MSHDVSPVRYLDPDTVTSLATDITAPLARTVSGYGSKLPTRQRVKLTDGRWRRVYVACYGNAGSTYVVVAGAPVFLDVDTEYALQAGVSHDRWVA